MKNHITESQIPEEGGSAACAVVATAIPVRFVHPFGNLMTLTGYQSRTLAAGPPLPGLPSTVMCTRAHAHVCTQTCTHTHTTHTHIESMCVQHKDAPACTGSFKHDGPTRL